MVASKVLISSHAFIYLSALAYFENCLILIDSFYLILDHIPVFSFKYVLKPLYHVPQMARTKRTARKSTGGRAFARRTVPAPAEPVPAPAPAPVPA